VLDLHPQSASWHGIPIVKPEEAPAAWRDATVIVTPLGNDVSSIHENLRRLGFANIVDIKEIVHP